MGLPGTIISVLETIENKGIPIYRIAYPDYPKTHLYIDSRFTGPVTTPQIKALPSQKTLLAKISAKIGAPYVWGGNWSAGIEKLLEYYPPKGLIDSQTHVLWTLKGVDCSGLLYEAANGCVPRNTLELIHFGKAVPLDESIRPLDMIVYPGHVFFILDELTTIESKFPFGVICRPLKERFWELERERKRVDAWMPGTVSTISYIIRRFL